jgi:predicted DNA-binding transcriptional regulator AlpA
MSIEHARPTQHRGRQIQRLWTIVERLGLKSSVTVWRWVREGTFPAPVNLNPSGTLIGWFEDEVDAFIANRPRGRAQPPAKALAERARLIKARKASAAPGIGHNSKFMGPTARFGFRRRAP